MRLSLNNGLCTGYTSQHRTGCQSRPTGVLDVVQVANQLARGVEPFNRLILFVEHLRLVVDL
ncbi:hypothetical protein D3C78_1798130 [compost metagenome]